MAFSDEVRGIDIEVEGQELQRTKKLRFRGASGVFNPLARSVDIEFLKVASGAPLGDGAQAVTFVGACEYTLPAGSLTDDGSVALDPTGLDPVAHVGLMARVVRLDVSEHDFVVANGGSGGAAEGTTQKTLPGGRRSVVDFRFDGSDFQLSGLAWLD